MPKIVALMIGCMLVHSLDLVYPRCAEPCASTRACRNWCAQLNDSQLHCSFVIHYQEQPICKLADDRRYSSSLTHAGGSFVAGACERSASAAVSNSDGFFCGFPRR